MQKIILIDTSGTSTRRANKFFKSAAEAGIKFELTDQQGKYEYGPCDADEYKRVTDKIAAIFRDSRYTGIRARGMEAIA